MTEPLSVLNTSYRVICLLGHGKGGYSYLVTDGATQYVLKQIHHEPCSYYSFGDKLAAEVSDYETLRAIGIPMPRLIAFDRENERILKEYIEGDTVFDRIARGEDVLPYRAQVESMCALLYPAGKNIDYFPTNFVIRDDQIFYVDYECNDYMEEWDFAHWGIQYWSQTEAFLAYLASQKADVQRS